MTQDVSALIRGLSPAQQAAIEAVRLSLDCFNSAEGAGLFSGPGRYVALTARVEICAVQARDMTQFWALLLKRMQWSVTPKWLDERVLAVLAAQQPAAVLRSLATETASVVTLARMLHDQEKQARRWHTETTP